VKTIPLTQGKEAIVDDEDYARFSSFKWCFHKGYAVRNTRIDGARRHIYLHREVAGLIFGDERQADHKNTNKLDCRRLNLRIASDAQNKQNVGKKANNTSGFKGVSRNGAKWRATIRNGAAPIYLGTFDTPEMAHAAYAQAARALHGEFARVE
jgi:hypothetical protein